MGSTSEANQPRPKVIVLAGPTAVGKSELSMQLARELGGEVISVDSVQVYRELDIGSMKPSREARAEIPHHLIDVLDLNAKEAFTAGDFVRKSTETIDEVIGRGRVPIVVGGTSMYNQWLVRGKPDAPRSDPEISKKVLQMLAPYRDANDWEGGLALLASKNADRAAHLFKNDWYRLERSLEIVYQVPDSSATFTGSRQDVNINYDFRCMFLVANREQLNRVIDLRCQEILRRGLLEETAALVARGLLLDDSPPARAIGYRQAVEYLTDPGISSGDVKALWRFVEDYATVTRRLSKSQMTWYRGQEEFMWLRWDLQDMSHPLQEALHYYHLTPGDYRAALHSDYQAQLKDMNLQEGKAMKRYISALDQLGSPGKERRAFYTLLERADRCREMVVRGSVITSSQKRREKGEREVAP